MDAGALFLGRRGEGAGGEEVWAVSDPPGLGDSRGGVPSGWGATAAGGKERQPEWLSSLCVGGGVPREGGPWARPPLRAPGLWSASGGDASSAGRRCAGVFRLPGLPRPPCGACEVRTCPGAAPQALRALSEALWPFRPQT